MGITDRRPRPLLRSRFISRDGLSNVLRKGESNSQWRDPYHLLLTLSWVNFFGLTVLVYVLTNALFALAYLAGGNGIENARPGSFSDAFFFSVQTMASIGYGAMYPRTTYTNVIVVVEALAGLLELAMVTGLMFARFARPTARVIFTNVAVIAPYDGVPTLMFRTANQRRNQILEAQLRVSLLRSEFSAEGQFMRRFHDLKLVRAQTQFFALTWTAMHPIDQHSPLYGITAASLVEDEVEIVISLTGIDETVSQPIHARHSYVAREILWNMRFVDILGRTAEGRGYVDYTQFHYVVPVDIPME